MITMIPRSQLEPHPDNPRQNLGDLSELAASIKRSGILQNLTVVPAPGRPGIYRVIIGHRRLAASEIAGLDELPCSIEEMDIPTQIATMLAENMQRNDLTIADQVGGVQTMLDLGESVKAIAEKTGMSETSVRKRVSIATLPRKQMSLAVDKGATMLDLLEVTKLEDPEAQAKVLESFGTNNFTYAVRNAKDDELRKKFKASVLPEIYAKFPRIIELSSETEKYSGRWDEIWRCGYRDDDRKPLPGPEAGAKYRLSEWGFGIAIYKENQNWMASKAREKDHNAWMKDRKATAKALNQEAFELRSAFVRRYRISTKAEFMDFYEMCMREMMRWKAFREGVGFYRSAWDILTIRKMLAIPYEEDRDKEEAFSHELERRGVHRASFLLAWALCGGITGCVRSDDGWCNEYNGTWKLCEDLDDQYRLLSTLGYEMSDFEKSLQDKSHEFFKERFEEGGGQ